MEESEAGRLLDRAGEAALRAYAPYSRFRVGAVVRDRRGVLFAGCNVESASYGLTVCAERAAILVALAAGAERPFTALAVACVDAPPGAGPDGAMPCGACRQVMAEHLAVDAPVHVLGAGTFRVADLLPHAFTLGAGD